MDTEVGRGVGQFHVVPGRGWQSKHCRRLQGTRQGRCGGCEPAVGGGGRRSGPRPHPEAPDLGQVDLWVVQAMAQGSPSPCCWNLMLF